MGATTTQGTGPGSADDKKSSNSNLDISKLVGPKVSYASSVWLSGSSTEVFFPSLIGSPNDYIIIITSYSASPTYVSSDLSLNTKGGNWKFTINGDSGSRVNFAIIKTGN